MLRLEQYDKHFNLFDMCELHKKPVERNVWKMRVKKQTRCRRRVVMTACSELVEHGVRSLTTADHS